MTDEGMALFLELCDPVATRVKCSRCGWMDILATEVLSVADGKTTFLCPLCGKERTSETVTGLSPTKPREEEDEEAPCKESTEKHVQVPPASDCGGPEAYS